jgi:hypothetical protein
MLVGGGVGSLQGSFEGFDVCCAIANQSIDSRLYGSDRAEYIAFRVSERIQAEPAQLVTQIVCVGIAQCEVMNEVPGTLTKSRVHAGEFGLVLVFQGRSPVTNCPELLSYLLDVSVAGHANSPAVLL